MVVSSKEFKRTIYKGILSNPILSQFAEDINEEYIPDEFYLVDTMTNPSLLRAESDINISYSGNNPLLKNTELSLNIGFICPKGTRPSHVYSDRKLPIKRNVITIEDLISSLRIEEPKDMDGKGWVKFRIKSGHHWLLQGELRLGEKYGQIKHGEEKFIAELYRALDA